MKPKIFLLTLTLLCSSGYVHAQPMLTASGPLEFCSGEQVLLCVEPEFQTYLWNTGSTEQCITVLESGEYWPVVLDSTGTVDSSLVTDPITVTVFNPEPYVVVSGDSIGDTLSVLGQFTTYQWFIDGQPIGGAMDSFLVVFSYGSYHVVVTDTNGCVGQSLLFEPYPNGIDEINTDESSLFLYPNPSNDVAILEFELATEQTVSIKLVDILGQVVEQFGNKLMAKGKHKVQFSCANLSQGIYFGVLQLGEEMRSFKVVKQ